MKMILPVLSMLGIAWAAHPDTSGAANRNSSHPFSNTMIVQDTNTTEEVFEDNKFVIYQIFTRLFGNKQTTHQYYGTLAQNGVGKFNDINDVALREIRKLGATHVWYTGVIEHAVLTDYTAHGIAADDPDVVKGRAGSPYAIKDYYDVNPDLAVDVKNRMAEFEALVKRTHNQGLKVIIDFVPNHVARRYHSDAKPTGVEDLGEKDDVTKSFDPNNNFYYLPGQAFKVPQGNTALKAGVNLGEDGRFDEFPAKATGNDQFSAEPSVNDWYETVKLNYGVNYQNGRSKHFDPIPSTWRKMHDILVFWAKKGVDGFRCDMAEMVPVEFWGWVIPKVRAVNPQIRFIAEIYNPKEYHNYINVGRFDFLYDKVGLYDTLRRLMEGHGDASQITHCWQEETRGIASHMVRFLENHDEQRIASKQFAYNAWAAVPAMTVSATLASGPVMVYFGQEVGERGDGAEGFSTEDGRTTIFDYWGVPAHQQWMNGGKFDGGGLDDNQKQLRNFYQTLLNLSTQHEAIRKGKFYSLQEAQREGRSQGYAETQMYTYLRYASNERLLIVTNFDRRSGHRAFIKIPAKALEAMGLTPEGTYELTDLLGKHPALRVSGRDVVRTDKPDAGIEVNLPHWGAAIFRIDRK